MAVEVNVIRRFQSQSWQRLMGVSVEPDSYHCCSALNYSPKSSQVGSDALL